MSIEVTRKCIYCEKEKPIAEFSLEHIFPDALGGSLCGDLFKTHYVCQRCNSICGIWVDAPVIKSWFSHNYSFENAREFIDLKKGSILPLIYMGIFPELTNEEKVCEVWLGPCGDTVYHFRKVFDSRYDSIVGGDFIDLKKNPGTAYLFVATDNSDWVKTVLFSFRDHFEYSRRISCNLNVTGNYENKEFFDQPTDEEIKIIEQLKTYRGKSHQNQFVIQEGFDQRFLCKVALGVGFNLFGDQFLKLDYTKTLRKGLWEQNYDERMKLGIKMNGFNFQENEFSKYLCYNGANLISLVGLDNYFVIRLCLFGKVTSQIAITNEKEIWKHLGVFPEGKIYLVFPQIKKHVGPIDFMTYIVSKYDVSSAELNELKEIESLRVDTTKLPPFRSKKYNNLNVA